MISICQITIRLRIVIRLINKKLTQTQTETQTKVIFIHLKVKKGSLEEVTFLVHISCCIYSMASNLSQSTRLETMVLGDSADRECCRHETDTRSGAGRHQGGWDVET